MAESKPEQEAVGKEADEASDQDQGPTAVRKRCVY